MGRGCLLYPDGSREWLDGGAWNDNLLVDEGEKNILDDWLGGLAIVSKYLFLIDDTVVETDTLASVTETETPGTDGYTRQQILTTDWAAAVLDVGDYQRTASAKTFGPNTGANWSIQHVGLGTVATGTAGLFLAAVPTGPVTVPTSISFQWTMKAKLR